MRIKSGKRLWESKSSPLKKSTFKKSKNWNIFKRLHIDKPQNERGHSSTPCSVDTLLLETELRWSFWHELLRFVGRVYEFARFAAHHDLPLRQANWFMHSSGRVLLQNTKRSNKNARRAAKANTPAAATATSSSQVDAQRTKVEQNRAAQVSSPCNELVLDKLFRQRPLPVEQVCHHLFEWVFSILSERTKWQFTDASRHWRAVKQFYVEQFLLQLDRLSHRTARQTRKSPAVSVVRVALLEFAAQLH